MYISIIVAFFELVSADIQLTTKSGPIQGTNARFAEDVETFLGIPYAEPPVGELRFSKPVPIKNWNDTLIASNMPPPCAQFSFGPYYFMPDLTNMSEDCLYLNIWIPKSKYDHGLRPVIIYIYGGAFVTGAVNQYDGSKIASRGDIMFATINYRVGALGYFLANVEEANGNMGMYDQIMAIKWIKDNAMIFGGDPENIVLMGQSAGAISVSAHLVSPLSRSLFKRAILESGSIIHPSIDDDNAKLFKFSKSVATMVGCTNDTVNLLSDPHSVVKCLKHKPIEDINEAEKTLSITNPVTFIPRVHDEFLPKSAIDLYREGNFRKDVDVLLGVNRDEGTLLLTIFSPEYFGHYGKNNVQSFTKSKAVLFMRGGESIVVAKPNFRKIIDFYLDRVRNRTSMGYTKAVANLMGDMTLACSTVFQADFLSLKGNSVYFYQFAFRSTSSPTAEWVGVSHNDELPYVFGIPIHGNFTAEEVELSNNMLDRWSAFARTGNPNLAGRMPWLRYGYHNPLYLDIGQEEESMRMNPLDRRCEVWRERFRTEIDTSLIRILRNSGINTTNDDTS